jgi:hypothetical protein
MRLTSEESLVMPSIEHRAEGETGARVPGPRRPHASSFDTPLPHEWIVELLSAMGCGRAGRKWQCPSHGGSGSHTASLVVGPRDDGAGAWLYCHAGCSLGELLHALGLQRAHLERSPQMAPARFVAARRLRTHWPPLRRASRGPAGRGLRHEAWHSYGPDHAKERLRRGDGTKVLRWESRNRHGEWVPGLLGVREADLPLYREDEIRMAAAAGETVVLCESESSCDVLRGVYATTWAGGASSVPVDVLTGTLGDVDVVIVPDHDEAGLACLERLLRALPRARVLIGDVGEDARDLYQRVGAPAFAVLLDAAVGRDPGAGRG